MMQRVSVRRRRRTRRRSPCSVGFAPIAGPGARILILGSLPGIASLAAQQYYAQPQNAFWRIMGRLAGAGPGLPYAERCARLVARGIAVWDVCESAHRPGSLDASIAADTIRANDFAGFFRAHPGIRRIGLNGATAARLYARLVLPTLPGRLRELPRLQLPSTSPAHATLSLEQKLVRWAELFED
jgi:hypoxanthine-DNA glycosylase